MHIKLGFELEIGCLTLSVFKFRKITLGANKALLHTSGTSTELLEFMREIVFVDIKREFRNLKQNCLILEYLCIETVSYIENDNTLFLEQNMHR